MSFFFFVTVVVDYSLIFTTWWLCLIDHTAVANSILFGALGVLVVKKNNSGIELYFAHNTESFVSPMSFAVYTSSVLMLRNRLSPPIPASPSSQTASCLVEHAGLLPREAAELNSLNPVS